MVSLIELLNAPSAASLGITSKQSAWVQAPLRITLYSLRSYSKCLKYAPSSLPGVWSSSTQAFVWEFHMSTHIRWWSSQLMTFLLCCRLVLQSMRSIGIIFIFPWLHIDQHMVQETLTYVAPHLSQHTPAGCVVVLQIASKHDVEDATPPQKSISLGKANAKDVGHESTYCSKGTA